MMWKILRDGKRLAVPVARPGGRMVAAQIRNPDRDLRRSGLLGIPVPGHPLRRISPDRLDLVVVPGLAFDPSGYRLGRGKGYFDRYLCRIPRRVPRVGLAFQFQVVPQVPVDPHDQSVNVVITEKRIYENPHRR